MVTGKKLGAFFFPLLSEYSEQFLLGLFNNINVSNEHRFVYTYEQWFGKGNLQSIPFHQEPSKLNKIINLKYSLICEKTANRYSRQAMK